MGKYSIKLQDEDGIIRWQLGMERSSVVSVEQRTIDIPNLAKFLIILSTGEFQGFEIKDCLECWLVRHKYVIRIRNVTTSLHIAEIKYEIGKSMYV